MGKIATSVSVPWVRSGISIKSICVRYTGDSTRATKTVLLRQMQQIPVSVDECFYHSFAVGLFLQHVQWILERVQHDGNQLGDPRPEHRH